MRKLLVVEDDPQIRDELVLFLERNGYEVAALERFDSCVDDIVAAAPNLVLLDLGLPGFDGQYVCRELHERAPIPLIVVTSRNTDMDELLALSFGADDFVAKPYNTQVLLAHIESVLRRSGKARGGEVLSCRGLVLDGMRCQVSYQGRTAELTKNELRILSLLLREAGSVVSRQRLQEELWSSDEFVDDNTLTVNVSHLRATLSDIGADGFVRTRRGIGYILE